MQNPASPHKFKRTCPACNRSVELGHKFCETCGTRIPELSTCSKCGTQFIAPVKFCDLCGAPVVLGEIPEPDVLPDHSEEEKTGPVEDLMSERDWEEIPEPDTVELPEDNHEENIVPVGENPHHYKEKIQEPDTDVLLEQYGDEYGDDETLESCHKPKSPSPIKRDAKKPFMVHAPPKRGSSGTVDDALFLSPGNPEAASKKPVDRKLMIGGGIVLIVVIAAVIFIGLPILTGNGGLSVHNNPQEVIPSTIEPIPPAPTITPVPVSRALVPQPTQLIPSGQKLYFQVQKNPVTSKISVIFTGSAGEGSISSADIKVTHPDGSIATGIILPLKGVAELTLEGSNRTDRVEIIAKMSSGEIYRVYDNLVPSVG